jgi:hypothetical protein
MSITATRNIKEVTINVTRNGKTVTIQPVISKNNNNNNCDCEIIDGGTL